LQTIDTLQIDSMQVAMWQQDGRFDYNRELVGGSETLLQWLSRVVMEWLHKTFGTVVDDNTVLWILLCVGVVVIAVIGWFIWRKRPKLFARSGRGELLDYELEEDTIYGMDFDELVKESLAREDYRQTVRLVYLQTLKALSDAACISWQPSKTPMQYVAEVDSADFAELSRQFMRVRYGNFSASKELVEQMISLQKAATDWIQIRGKGGEEA